MTRSAPLLIALVGGLAGCGDTIITLTDGNNYTYTGTVDLPTVTTASGVDLDICWDAVTSDIQCHDVVPDQDLNLLSMIRFPLLDEAAMEEKLSNDSLLQSDQSGYVELETNGATCASLSELSFFGTPVDVASEYTAEIQSYLLTLATGTTTGVGTRAMVLLQPDEASDVTAVSIPAACGILENFSADIESLTAVPIPADGPWIVDWSELTTNGLGNDLSLGNVDGILLGFYEGASLTDLQDQFLDLELLATDVWSMELPGSTGADLSDLSGFTGFEGDGVWVLALTCSTCANPAPLFLTILQPE